MKYKVDKISSSINPFFIGRLIGVETWGEEALIDYLRYHRCFNLWPKGIIVG